MAIMKAVLKAAKGIAQKGRAPAVTKPGVPAAPAKRVLTPKRPSRPMGY